MFDAVNGALAQLIPTGCRPRARAATHSPSSPAGRPGEPFIYFELVVGTWGARPTADGNDGLCNPRATAANIPVEVAESEFPIRIERYGLVPDSGGAGRYRGGLAIERAWRTLAPDTTLQVRSDRQNHAPYGLAGGRRAACPRTSRERRRPRPSRRCSRPRSATAPSTTTAWPAAAAGETARARPGSGRRRRAQREGRRRERAEHYGVVLGADGSVDEAATAALRKERRRERPRAPPDAAEVERLAALDGLGLEPGEAEELLPVIASLTEFADVADRLDDALALPGRRGVIPVTARPRREPVQLLHPPLPGGGRGAGPLAGLAVGIKDNISLAGVPTTNGSHVRRARPSRRGCGRADPRRRRTIVGKLNMDDFGSSGLGETSAFGPARNPVDPTRSAGGSSGGSGSAVRAGEVELALGVDQGGSGRIPAAFCGVVAAKGTHGLVPSWGITHIDHTIDFVTPIARTVDGAARLLEVIAGGDWRDPQWVRADPIAVATRRPRRRGRRAAHRRAARERRPGRLRRGRAREPARRRRRARGEGAEVGDVAIPLWRDGLAMFLPYIGHLFADTFRSEGQGGSHLGAYDVDAMVAFARMRRDRAGSSAAGQGVARRRPARARARAGVPYARLHNARLALRRDVTAAFED